MATQKKPEWEIQAWLYRFAERILLPPFEVRCVDHAGAVMANMSTRMMALGRGLKPGFPDMMIWQGEPLLMLPVEIKHEGSERPGQTAFAEAMLRCGSPVARECRKAAELVDALRRAGFRLHANADNLAAEYQARIDAGLRELAATRSAPKKRSTRPHRSRNSLSAGERSFAAAYAGKLR